MSKKEKGPYKKNRKFYMACTITIVTCFVFLGGLYALASNFMNTPPEVEDEFIFEIPIEEENPNDRPAIIVLDDEDLIRETLNVEPEVDTIHFTRRPGVFTFLLYGLDEGYNVDSIMVALFDTNDRSVHIIGMPRDTKVESSRRTGLSKLVASYPSGRARGGGHEGGVERLSTEVASLIGFVPDFYIGINLRAFVRVIDGIGGVTVHVPFHMRYNDPYQNLHIDIPAGTQRLSGQQALHFARFRQADEGFRSINDFQRIENQQTILAAVLDEMLSPRSITQIPEFIRIYQEHVYTNISNSDLVWFGADVALNGIDSFETHTIPIARTERNGWYEVPDRDGLLELINRTINPFTRDIEAGMLRIVS